MFWKAWRVSRYLVNETKIRARDIIVPSIPDQFFLYHCCTNDFFDIPILNIHILKSTKENR